jgi:L-alanine-DL-glutamate epimerase-like enolase superfamily enzyme
MRLEELEVIPYSLPFREPYVTSRGELRERRLILIRVRGEGLEGLGETAALSLRGGPGIEEVASQISERCWPALLDGGLDPARIWSALARCRSRGASPQALAAVDIALHDLAAKASGRPVWRLLGASSAVPVVCNATLPAANPAATRKLAESWATEGFRTFKLKVGLAGDVTQVATIRQVLGPAAKIRIDANGAWDVGQATERLGALARHTIEVAEEPVATLEQMVQLRAHITIPVAADESLIGPRDARRAVELGACQMAAVKLAKAGGIAQALEISRLIPSYLSSALEGPVAISAAAHTVQAIQGALPGDLAHGLATERLFSTTVGRGATPEGDRLLVGDAPGLGVEIDDDALAARRLD